MVNDGLSPKMGTQGTEFRPVWSLICLRELHDLQFEGLVQFLRIRTELSFDFEGLELLFFLKKKLGLQANDEES